MRVIIVGPDRGLGDAFDELGVDVTRIPGLGTAHALEEAGVRAADYVVITDVTEATAIPLARDVNPAIRAVIYSESSMPDFVSALVDFAVSPDVFRPVVFAEELAGRND